MSVHFKNLPRKPTDWPFLRAFYYLAEETPCHQVMHMVNLEYTSVQFSDIVKYNAHYDEPMCFICGELCGNKCHCHGLSCKACFPEQFCKVCGECMWKEIEPMET